MKKNEHRAHNDLMDKSDESIASGGKPYTAPKILKFGELRTLVRGNTGERADSGSLGDGSDLD